MLRWTPIAALTACAVLFPSPAFAQQEAKAKVAAIRLEGLKTLAEDPVKSLAGLQLGDLVDKEGLQAAADRLIQTGLFSQVNYEFRTVGEALTVTYRLEEAQRVPILFDNIPWFADSELNEAIRKAVPVYDGTAPQEGPLLDQMAAALATLLAGRGLQVTVEHQLLADPAGDGTVQQFRILGATIMTGNIEFGDALAAQSRLLQQKLSEVAGKPYSRLVLEIFLSERVRPLYQEQGYLRAQIGKPEVRLRGNPKEAFSGSIDIFVPVVPGSIYRWGGAQWTGNEAVNASELNAILGFQAAEVANGQKLLAGWGKILDEYAHRGYLDAKVDPQPAYAEDKRTVSYQVRITEGPQYRYGEMVITGLSVAAEKKLRESWKLPPGAVFDRAKFEELLLELQQHSTAVFGNIPIHYDEVGHWLRTNPDAPTVDVLLDFK